MQRWKKEEIIEKRIRKKVNKFKNLFATDNDLTDSLLW